MQTQPDFEIEVPAPQADSGLLHYQVHQRVAQATAGRCERPLFALLPNSRRHSARLRLRLPIEHASVVADSFGAELRRLDNPPLVREQQYDLLLTVNNAVRRTGMKSYQVLSQADEVVQWIADKLQRGGISITNPAVHHLPTLRFEKQGDHRVTLARARIAAQATISDPDLARETFVAGIGHGRAFGLGLPILFAH